MKDLTQSAIDRQNILNNPVAILEIQKHVGLTGFFFEDEYLYTSKLLANFFDISTRTLRNIINDHELEIKHNGYKVLEGKKLKEFKAIFGPLLTKSHHLSQEEMNFPLSEQQTDNQSFKKIKNLAVFNFRAFLNIGMLLTESEKAKLLRSTILDIIIDTLNQKVGGSTKYINQRDEEFIMALTREPAYRKEFTNALNLYLDMGPYKYTVYTDAIYMAIFKEHAKEYKAILKLDDKDNPRETMYSEVLKLIASFEIGIADEMQELSEALGRKLIPEELDELIKNFTKKRHWIPLIEDACIKMASRDYGFRDIIHDRLKQHIGPLSTEEYSRFLGDRSKDFIERIVDNPELLNIFKRLKDR